MEISESCMYKRVGNNIEIGFYVVPLKSKGGAHNLWKLNNK